jgi:putative ABC transport system permease protein
MTSDVRYALRRLRNAPTFAAVTIATLSLGIGATTAMFSIVNSVVLRPLPVAGADRLVRIYETNPNSDSWTTSEPNYLDFRDRARSYSTTAAIRGRGASLLGRGDPVSLSGLAATASYFVLFGERPLAGSPYGIEQDQVGGDTHVVVLSEGVWRRLFGADPRVVGMSIDLDGVPHRVSGVMPAGYGYLPSDFWVPLAPDPSANRGNHLLFSFGRLKPGVSVAQANAEAVSIAAELSRQFPKSNGQWGARVESLADSIVGPDLRHQLYLLLGAVGFLLLLACANVANLQLGQAVAREREMSVRAALGAGGGRLVRQLLTESVVFSVLGAVGGIAIAWAAIPIIRSSAQITVPRLEEVTMDVRVLVFALAVAVVTGLLFGLAPALHVARSDLQTGLRKSSRAVAGTGRKLQQSLIAAEVALAVVLLVGAGLLARSFVQLQRVPTGFRLDGLLQMTVTAPNDMPRDQRGTYFHQIEAALAAVPGVASVGASSVAPFSGGNTTTQFLAEGHEPAPNEYFAADWRSVTPGVFKSLGIDLLRGRTFDDSDTQGHPNVVVIGETMAKRLWPGQSPIGRHVMGAQSARTAADQFEVIGVVRDVLDQSLAANPAPAVYFTEYQKPWVQLTYFVRPQGGGVRTAGGAAFLDAIRRAIREAAPTTPVPDITPLATNVNVALAPQRFTTGLLTGFAAVALLLASVGIFGVISFSVTQRTSEIGVRLAFGASPGRVTFMVMRDAAAIVSLGAALGCAVAALLGHLITSLLFATKPIDAATYGSVLATLLIVSGIASYLPARRAARTDPAVALREM